MYLDSRYPGKYEYQNYCFTYKPMYGGKGSYGRITRHLDIADKSNDNRPFYNTLRLLKRENYPIIYFKLEEGILDEELAYKKEELILREIKIHRDGGPLMNLTYDWLPNRRTRDEVRNGAESVRGKNSFIISDAEGNLHYVRKGYLTYFLEDNPELNFGSVKKLAWYWNNEKIINKVRGGPAYGWWLFQIDEVEDQFKNLDNQQLRLQVKSYLSQFNIDLEDLVKQVPAKCTENVRKIFAEASYLRVTTDNPMWKPETAEKLAVNQANKFAISNGFIDDEDAFFKVNKFKLLGLNRMRICDQLKVSLNFVRARLIDDENFNHRRYDKFVVKFRDYQKSFGL
jgi:hypothetical protein